MDDKDEMKRIPIHTISTLPRYGWFPDEIEQYHAGDYVRLQDVLNCVVPSSGNAALAAMLDAYKAGTRDLPNYAELRAVSGTAAGVHVAPDGLIALLQSLKPNYGAVWSRDDEVAEKRKRIEDAIGMLCNLAAPAALSERAAKLTDKRIFAIRDSIKPGDGWDGDQWDLAIAYAIESAIAGQPGEKK
jgi:hypothetical protein